MGGELAVSPVSTEVGIDHSYLSILCRIPTSPIAC